MSESMTVRIPEELPPLGGVHLAAAGFLARHSGRTRDACSLDLRTFVAWCATRGVAVFAMTRPYIELYVRWMEEDRDSYAAATTARRPSTVVGFYRFATIDGHLDRSPAEYVRHPREDRARGNLDRHANHIVAAFVAGAA